MDSSALEDRHAFLHPQQRLVGGELRQQEPGPAAVARVRCEQLVERRSPPLHLQGRGTTRRVVEGPVCDVQDPSTMSLRAMVPLPEKSWGGWVSRIGARGDGSAGDERKASCHTTHNACVLLLFFIRRLSPKSQWRDSGTLLPASVTRGEGDHSPQSEWWRRQRRPRTTPPPPSCVRRSPSQPYG